MLRIYNEAALSAPPRCVCFDIDNTLYPYEPAHRKAMNAVLEKIAHELGIKTREAEQAFIEARGSIKQQLGNTAASHSRLLYFNRSIELLGFHTQPLLALDLEQRYWGAFMNNIVLYEGCKDFLAALQGAGIALCLVSDLTAQIQYRKILFLELDSFFDFIVTSEESGRDKPDAASFLLAGKKTGIEPRHTWMIGDSPSADIAGGKTAGLTTLLLGDDGKRQDADPPDLIFTAYPALHEYMKKKGWLGY
jgi:putative hydrolase of the HAD superfamily